MWIKFGRKGKSPADNSKYIIEKHYFTTYHDLILTVINYLSLRDDVFGIIFS